MFILYFFIKKIPLPSVAYYSDFVLENYTDSKTTYQSTKIEIILKDKDF